jgi:hypothetical protein
VTFERVRSIVVINNSISAELVRQDLLARGRRLDQTALILLRDVREPWMDECAIVLRYPGRPSQSLIGQLRFMRFYRAAARLLRRLQCDASVRDIYLVNNDNLVTSHLLSWAETDGAAIVTVAAEGLMNYQEIGLANRASWRWWTKPIVARALGFRYRQPRGHLSGAFEPRVDRVVSFSAEGLKAPPKKVVVRKFGERSPLRESDPSVALVVLTGLNQWMDEARFVPFAHAFVDWVKGAGFRKILVKKHPRVSAGLMEELLADHEEVGRDRAAEDMAADLEAGTIVGACCTALVTLKLVRPDLKCIDFGSDYYIEHAYRGDDSIKTLLLAAGVSLVQMPVDTPIENRSNA